MKKITTTLFSLLCLQMSMYAQPKADKGFKLLFDGTTTNGWHKFNKPGTIGKGWQAKDGVLMLDPAAKDGGDIVTDNVYENFHLKLEWKVAEGSNSGVMFFVQEGEQYSHPWKTGPEMQVLDNDRHADAKIHKHRAGDLYDMIASSSEPVKPVGEWNLAEIICNKGKLTFKLNGVVIVETTYNDASWTQMIANSKFKNMPGFGSFTQGKIGLQDHGDLVWFRNIQIKALK